MASSCLSFAARRIEGSSSAAGGVTVGAAAVVFSGAGAVPGGVQAAAAAMRRAQQRMCVGAHEAKGCDPETSAEIKLITKLGTPSRIEISRWRVRFSTTAKYKGN